METSVGEFIPFDGRNIEQVWEELRRQSRGNTMSVEQVKAHAEQLFARLPRGVRLTDSLCQLHGDQVICQNYSHYNLSPPGMPTYICNKHGRAHVCTQDCQIWRGTPFADYIGTCPISGIVCDPDYDQSQAPALNGAPVSIVGIMDTVEKQQMSVKWKKSKSQRKQIDLLDQIKNTLYNVAKWDNQLTISYRRCQVIALEILKFIEALQIKSFNVVAIVLELLKAAMSPWPIAYQGENVIICSPFIREMFRLNAKTAMSGGSNRAQTTTRKQLISVIIKKYNNNDVLPVLDFGFL